MMAKSLDPHIVNPILTRFVEELITTKGNLAVSRPCEIASKPIEEYEDRMRIIATDKFDVAVYIAAISFYLNQAEMHSNRARGAIICYMDTEVADKIFKAAGLQVPYDEDDETMMVLCGSLCQLIADALISGLAAAGYVKLLTSPPDVHKNTISDGVEFDKDQNEKQEISFHFLKHKALVIDWTLSPIPTK
jgi:hypothetical protein